MSKAGQNMVLITKQRRYKVRITSKEQKSGKYSYFPGHWEILVFTGKYWEIRLILNLQI
jgi:type IV secretory pathway VirB9-like protein